MTTRKVSAVARAALCALATAVLIAACGGDDDDGAVSGTGYEYTLPEGWTSQSATGDGAEIASPIDSAATLDGDPVPATGLNVVRGNAPPGLTLEQFTRASVRTISDPSTWPPGISFTSAPSRPAPTKLGGERAMAVEHDGEFQGDGTKGEYRQRQLLMLRDGTAYVLTFASSPASPEESDSDGSDFEQIIDSWRWR